MLLVQVFKTGEGARKRCAFENAHSKSHIFTVVRMCDGKRDEFPFTVENFSAYTWQLEKKKR